MNTDTELHKVDTALKGYALVDVWAVRPSWVKDGVVRGWTVVIEHNGQLGKVQAYHKELTTTGMHQVEITKNTRNERTIRPWKG